MPRPRFQGRELPSMLHWHGEWADGASTAPCIAEAAARAGLANPHLHEDLERLSFARRAGRPYSRLEVAVVAMMQLRRDAQAKRPRSLTSLHACSLVSGVPDARARPDACDE